jgi:NAD-dependent deacetylase
VVVGSTLVVQPAASMPLYALDAGAYLAIINLTETPIDEMSHLIIREKAGIVLGRLTEAVEKTLAASR